MFPAARLLNSSTPPLSFRQNLSSFQLRELTCNISRQDDMPGKDFGFTGWYNSLNNSCIRRCHHCTSRNNWFDLRAFLDLKESQTLEMDYSVEVDCVLANSKSRCGGSGWMLVTGVLREFTGALNTIISEEAQEPADWRQISAFFWGFFFFENGRFCGVKAFCADAKNTHGS